jgi:pyridinium-3,5-bisthiocarboxylic acid mononucleotide nickel chelatase
MGQRILYYDCFAGISGDMNLGALVDAGVPQDHVIGEVARLGLGGYTLRFSRAAQNGIHGTRADVEVEGGHGAAALHGGHGGAAPHAGSSPHTGHAGHSSHSQIVKLIGSSPLAQGVKDRALAIFDVLARAEARVHDRPVGEVRFHEVGAVDSIVDIVGAAVCLEYLKPDRVLCSPVELGGGFVKAAHGLLPVPAPATAEILSGVPVKSGAVPFEMTTPTGAAVLKASVTAFGTGMRFTITRVAYGVGHRTTEIPNLLRVFLAEADAGETAEDACVLECNIDDMVPELYSHLAEVLFAAGAADVWFTPIVMKKSRPAVTVSVLCEPEAEGGLAGLLLRETTTFGLRRVPVRKTALPRESRTVTTSLGPVRVKTAFLDGRPVKSKPEYEDCLRIARERGMPLREVYAAVLREIG